MGNLSVDPVINTKWVLLNPSPGQELRDKMPSPDSITSAGTHGRGEEWEFLGLKF